MRKSRFTGGANGHDAKQTARRFAETAKKHKLSKQTIYVWRKRFGELSPQDIKRLRALEGENARCH